jgi:hypothetical protein
MREATLKDWQELCKQAVIERDPVRLLKLFLKIDRLHSHGTLKPWREPPASHATQQIPCPYCSALLEPQEQIVDHNVFRCPWCEGRFGSSDFNRKETEDAMGKNSFRERPSYE